MNEIVRNNKPGEVPLAPANAIDPAGITITSQPVGVIHAKNIRFSGANQHSESKFEVATPTQGPGA